MKQIILLLVIVVLYGCSSTKKTEHVNKNKANSSLKSESMNISMFPRTKENQFRHLIELSVLQNEKEHKVEIFVVKEIKVDCNTHWLQGELKEKNVEGWGYNYYVFETNGEVLSTLMACPDDTLTKKEVLSQSKLLPYNSKLPIVVYTPNGYKVKYKIWSLSSEEYTAVLSAKSKRLTLKFESKEKLTVTNTKAIITIYGFDSSLADASATAIAKKEIEVTAIPFSVTIDLPQNPENLIVPPIKNKKNANYYLSLEMKDQNIQLDYSTQKSDIDIRTEKEQVFFIKNIELNDDKTKKIKQGR